jgi:hypothetical protein
MRFAIRNSDYLFVEHAAELSSSINFNDEAALLRRAIERQAFSVGLYRPYPSELDTHGRARGPRENFIAVARRHAAVRASERGAARRNNIARLCAADTNIRLKAAVRRGRVLDECLHLRSGGLSDLLGDPSQTAYACGVKSQFSKSKALADLIAAYMSNGQDLPDTFGHPRAIKIMRTALREARIIKISERTLANYFVELGATAVFHYLIWYQACRTILRPWNPCDPKFLLKIMRRARSTDDFRAVCHLYNTVASELNDKYRFGFRIIENMPNPEAPTDYDTLARDKPNPQLTKAIKAVIGCTD